MSPPRPSLPTGAVASIVEKAAKSVLLLRKPLGRSSAEKLRGLKEHELGVRLEYESDGGFYCVPNVEE